MLNKQKPTTTMGKALLKTAIRAMDERLKPNYEKNLTCATATVLDLRYKHCNLTELTMLPPVQAAVKEKLRSMPNQAAEQLPLVELETENKDPNENLWADVDDTYKRTASSSSERDTGVQEFNLFNSDPTVPRNSCPGKFWHTRNKSKLSCLAVDALLPMASSVALERIASKLNYFVGDLKTRVTDDYLSKRIFLYSLPKYIIAQLSNSDIKD